MDLHLLLLVLSCEFPQKRPRNSLNAEFRAEVFYYSAMSFIPYSLWQERSESKKGHGLK